MNLFLGFLRIWLIYYLGLPLMMNVSDCGKSCRLKKDASREVDGEAMKSIIAHRQSIVKDFIMPASHYPLLTGFLVYIDAQFAFFYGHSFCTFYIICIIAKDKQVGRRKRKPTIKRRNMFINYHDYILSCLGTSFFVCSYMQC